MPFWLMMENARTCYFTWECPSIYRGMGLVDLCIGKVPSVGLWWGACVAARDGSWYGSTPCLRRVGMCLEGVTCRDYPVLWWCYYIYNNDDDPMIGACCAGS